MSGKRYPAEIARLPMLAAFDLRGEPDGLAIAADRAGLGRIAARNRAVAAGGGVSVLRLGPRRMLLLAPLAEEERLAGRLAQAFSDVVAADFACVSDMLAAFAVEGAGALDVLRQGAPLDLSAEAFPQGTATGTELFALAVILMRESVDPDRFVAIVERSFADYLESWLHVACGLPAPHKPATIVSPPASYQPG